jgi:succinate dehydrogenase / fumarate reductase membrane anchor subunit
MRTPLGKVRGLGSAKHGTGEFIVMRVTSVALLFLLTAFIVLIVALQGQSYEVVRATLAAPAWSLVLVAGILLTVVHMRIGMQVIIEDYVHTDMTKFALLIGNWLFSWGVGAVATFAVLKIAFGA